MKIKSNLFFKSFLISFIVLGLVAAIVITNLYVTKVAVDPENRESNILIGLTNNGKIISLTLLHCDPQDKSVTFLAIPDNTMLSNGNVIQNLYQPGDPELMIDYIESISGADVNRYIIFSMDAVVSLVNNIGEFEYLIRFPFVYNGTEYSRTTPMTGELSRAMFTYKQYDMTNVSLSKIGETFLANFILNNSNMGTMDTIYSLLKSMARIDMKTNLSDKEMREYCNFFANFSSMKQNSVYIDGETVATSSSLYFIPTNDKLTQNIFK